MPLKQINLIISLELWLHNRGYNAGRGEKAKEIAERLLIVGMPADVVAGIVGLDRMDI